ncbi:hypothetical protein ACOMHN_067568 [Nucella lapillus]
MPSPRLDYRALTRLTFPGAGHLPGVAGRPCVTGLVSLAWCPGVTGLVSLAWCPGVASLVSLAWCRWPGVTGLASLAWRRRPVLLQMPWKASSIP